MQIHRYKLKESLIAGEIFFGPFVKLPCPSIVEIFGHAGFDFVVIDREHGPLSFESVESLVRAAECVGIVPVVRVSHDSPAEIQRVLDIGAQAIEVPQIESTEQAVNVVHMSKYAPLGKRGLCRFVRAANYSAMECKSYLDLANQETMVILQIEGPAGIACFQDILSVGGVDIIFLGPYDLSQALGVPGEVSHPLVQKEMQKMVTMAKERGAAIGTFADTIEAARFWAKQGVQYIAYSVDVGILTEASQRILAALKDLKAD